MGARRPGWGTVNAVLNRLVAEGMIAAFRTSFRRPQQARDFCVRFVRVGLVLVPQQVSADGLADGTVHDAFR